MKHYGIMQWVDFARGVISAREAEDMRQHLAGGCAECRDMAGFCDKLAVVCSGMVPRQVPESAVRLARGIFRVQAPRPARRSFLIPVELIFDSFLVPSPVGMRASWQVGWQALFQAGDCSLDLRVEPELHTSRAAIIGQVANHKAPETEMNDLPVCLKSGKLVVAETRSNGFGEFQMEYEQQKRLQLCVYLDGGKRCIRVPLKRLAADGPVGGNRLNAEITPRKKRSGETGRNRTLKG